MKKSTTFKLASCLASFFLVAGSLARAPISLLLWGEPAEPIEKDME